MLGSAELAKEIGTFPWVGKFEIHEVLDYNTMKRKDASFISVDLNAVPEGWTLLGTGCSRNSYLGPDGVVYKVQSGSIFNPEEFGPGACYLSENFSEAFVYASVGERIAEISEGRARLAPCHYWDAYDVLAMEYSEKVDDCAYDSEGIVSFFKDQGLGGDLHDGNVWIDAKGAVLIDYAHVARRIRADGTITALEW